MQYRLCQHGLSKSLNSSDAQHLSRCVSYVSANLTHMPTVTILLATILKQTPTKIQGNRSLAVDIKRIQLQKEQRTTLYVYIIMAFYHPFCLAFQPPSPLSSSLQFGVPSDQRNGHARTASLQPVSL